MERQATENLPAPVPHVQSRINPETLQLTHGSVAISGLLNPWTFDRTSAVGWEGESLYDMLLRLSGGLVMPSKTIVCVGDRQIPEKYWRNVYPKNGAIVTVNVVVQDSQVMRTVALIGVGLAAAAISGGALAGVFAGGGFGAQLAAVGGAWGAGGWAASAAAVATLAVGTLAINALIPLPTPKFESERSSPTLSITGARNVEKPFSPVPQILGTYRFTPPLAATPFTTLSGSDQDLTMLFTAGRGPLELDQADFKIAETPLTSFSNYQLEVNEGYQDDPIIQLYPSQVEQVPLNIRIYNGYWAQGGGVHPDPNPCTATGPTIPPGPGQTNCYIRTTSIPCSTFRVDISQPAGGIRIKDQGDREEMTVTTEVWYRVSGVDPYVLGATHTETSKTSSLLRYSMEVTPNPGGPEEFYDVLVRRISPDDREGVDPDGDNTRYSATWWTSLTAISNSAPITTPSENCISQISLRIRATSQLNGVIDEFNLIGKTVCLDYDGTPGVWVRRTTSNPASLFRYVLQGTSNPDPMHDCRINLTDLENWHDFCQTRGYTFDMVRDFQATVWDCLRDIAAAGRARPDQIDGLWTVVVDNQANYATPVQLFSPRNSWNFAASRQFVDAPHAFRVRFVDSENEYQQTEKIAYDDGYDELNATRFESIEFPGLVTWRNNECMAKYQLAVSRLRAESYSWEADIEHIVCVQGDSVLVQHDSIKIGTGAARIKAINGNDITLDAEVVVPGSPAIVNRQSSTGTIRTDPVTATGGTPAGELTDTFTYSAIPAEVSVGNLITIGELNSETLHVVIDSIVPKNNESAVLRAFPVAPLTDVLCS